MKENTKIKIVIVALVILSFMLGTSTRSYFGGDAHLDRIDEQITQLLEIDRQLVELEKESIEIKKEQKETIEESTFVSKPIYSFTEDEIFLLAQLLCGQAGKDGDGEYDFETQIASGNINWPEVNKVLEVVMNRVLTPGIYADNVTDVVLQPGAFTVMPENSNKTPSPEVVDAIRYWTEAFNSPEYVPSIPDDHYWFSGSRGSNITRDHF